MLSGIKLRKIRASDVSSISSGDVELCLGDNIFSCKRIPSEPYSYGTVVEHSTASLYKTLLPVLTIVLAIVLVTTDGFSISSGCKNYSYSIVVKDSTAVLH